MVNILTPTLGSSNAFVRKSDNVKSSQFPGPRLGHIEGPVTITIKLQDNFNVPLVYFYDGGGPTT